MVVDHWGNLMRVKKRYAQALEPVCKECGLTRNEVDVLLFLANNPGFDTATDMVERRGIAKSHVSAAVQNLQSRGLLERSFRDGDRRTAHLTLTEQGKRVAQQGQRVQYAFFARAFAGFSEEEMMFARQLAERVGENINHMEG